MEAPTAVGSHGIVVEFLADEEAGGHLGRLGGESVGLIEVFGFQVAAGKPGEGGGEFRGWRIAGLPGARHAFGAGQVVLGDQSSHSVDDGDLLGRGKEGAECGEKWQGDFDAEARRHGDERTEEAEGRVRASLGLAG